MNLRSSRALRSAQHSRCRAGERQRGKADFGLTHNLGGAPFNSVVAVAILGRLD